LRVQCHRTRARARRHEREGRRGRAWLHRLVYCHWRCALRMSRTGTLPASTTHTEAGMVVCACGCSFAFSCNTHTQKQSLRRWRTCGKGETDAALANAGAVHARAVLHAAPGWSKVFDQLLQAIWLEGTCMCSPGVSSCGQPREERGDREGFNLGVRVHASCAVV
jgi:hypothetical protein